MTITTIGLLDDKEIELDLAALALSELDHIGIDLGPCIELLEEITAHLRMEGMSKMNAVEQAQVLAATFHGKFGFSGDVDSYDAPLNADMIRVLDRRRGLPVSLSLLYVAGARRVGWTAEILNIPGHVLVRIGDEPSVVIDPFHGGAVVGPMQVLALTERATGDASDASDARDRQFGPMTNRDVLARLLFNQASRAEAAGDASRALTVYARMTVVAPDNPDGWWALARLQLMSGSEGISAARRSLTSMLEVTRSPQRREQITEALAAIADF
jgi:regulator of sirC expression with transglutaminase-like and TPR domain